VDTRHGRRNAAAKPNVLMESVAANLSEQLGVHLLFGFPLLEFEHFWAWADTLPFLAIFINTGILAQVPKK
jgi:hypothetical protein